MDREKLLQLTDRLIDAFNRMDLDDVVSMFSETGTFDDSDGISYTGHREIRTAFEPLFSGARGKIHFEGEDLFAEVETGKVMTSWMLTLTKDGVKSNVRGMDVLEFSEDKLIRKSAYLKK